ncbi:MAG: hypothetical protein ACO1PM_16415 [Acidovorax sp.]
MGNPLLSGVFLCASLSGFVLRFTPNPHDFHAKPNAPRTAIEQASPKRDQMAAKKNGPGWSDVKAQLAGMDRADLIRLLQDMYAASKENQSFLHARYALGDDVLKPYKATIDRWLWPDFHRNQDFSVSKAKKAISDFKKAVGLSEGAVELMVFYCERSAGFSNEFGLQDEGYFDALVLMFKQALDAVQALPLENRQALLARLDAVRHTSHAFGYGVGDDMDRLLAKAGLG